MPYALGQRSLARLEGVHPVLVAVVKRAIEITTQDFGVYEGVRTMERQRKLVASGASKTLNSMHIPAVDRLGHNTERLGHAVDLVPWIDGEFRWEWGPCYAIAFAVRTAAAELDVAGKMNWGGVWDRWMTDLPGTEAGIKLAVKQYAARHPGPDFLDAPHFQVGRKG